ncbi:MAG: Glycosyl transferase, group 2 family domain protein [Candidatus Falkowbacteria bacterium GW2011_GWC2_38_22]|uniref:Glycosyl transferase, group 2 family domain protein n=1 Tax=Candidatus Falkowbacteria bacterium GW2011_GWE1_38_31 TaxID=1618638 RepID=A0A0G0K4J9_9BACT|nr:MAG: Glycosyl transferase, group 2 family domain protein [Candidatus Falkowbacteria bacterium GW2011_GWF2_38_1205]KKQ61496.1 MAG: Glycosyl transferase, group 2 family domain protein [Candidatus Falkowbacteria bacterium GW2011_GWC2_38_22]KKQ63611.1 MAG: Glycosyl transferase, group 2 family domain protein [Candidatus Falkowbacteria bacterium GW2011_GWF1_38_22]KKQ65763.1 MAG: Glycosyl transferase, group 2 family domain protein [Candidatus Falkowbacteria bacterium GW2011_GWE2_38_254]KKQ70380.1 M
MENKLQISIVIPVYNEELALTKTLEQIKEVMARTGLEHEIIAVNDGSKDKSGEILKNTQGIIALDHIQNKGYGASLKTGIKKSRFDRVLIIDADGTYPINSIPEMLNYAKNYDQVIGARGLIKDGENAIPSERKLAKKFLNRFAGYLVGCNIPDLNSGFRLFRKDVVYKYWELFPDKFSFSSTLTMTFLSHGFETKFFPIEYYKRVGQSSIKATDFFNFLKLVTKLSLFFKPIKVFTPLSLLLLLFALLMPILFLEGVTQKFLDTTFIVLCATALQTFFFGLLAEIVIHNK